jgi:hypothetical protein
MNKLILPLLLLLSACGGSESVDENGSDTALVSEQTVAVIAAGSYGELSCKNNSAANYTVYIPENAVADSVYPVVIFFAPDGKGLTPLEKYKNVADQWKFILVGSNSNKNGMDAALAIETGNSIVDDVKGRFNIDPARIYLSGFSGGARVASGVALSRLDITGVIGCSAAPPKSLQPLGFIGIAGLGDMNYLELKKFVAAEDGKAGLHELLVFDGKHEWPPVPVMRNAMLMVSLYQPGNAQSGNLNQMSDSLTQYVLESCDTLSSVSCLLESNLLNAAIHAEKNLSSVEKLEVRADKLKSGNCVRNDEQKWRTVEKNESDLQKLLSESVLTRDTTWWRQNSGKYFETNASGLEKYMRSRLRGYVSLLCYTYCKQAFSMNNLHAAEKLVKVYSIVDPENPEWAYMQATLFSQLGMREFVIPSLGIAVALGFNDVTRLQSDPVFASFAQEPGFQQLIAKIQSN